MNYLNVCSIFEFININSCTSCLFDERSLSFCRVARIFLRTNHLSKQFTSENGGRFSKKFNRPNFFSLPASLILLLQDHRMPFQDSNVQTGISSIQVNCGGPAFLPRESYEITGEPGWLNSYLRYKIQPPACPEASPNPVQSLFKKAGKARWPPCALTVRDLSARLSIPDVEVLLKCPV